MGGVVMGTASAVKERLTDICRARGIAFHALATHSGVHPSTVKGIINGSSKNPGIVTIKKLCDGLDLSLCDFFDTDVFRALEQEIQ
jgi:transcriptional regulator with XRE-family HTH domain